MLKKNPSFTITAIVLVLVLVGFIIYGVTSSNTISKNNKTIDSLNDKVASDTTQISTLKSQLTSKESDLTKANDQISSLQSENTSLQSEVSSLESDTKSLQKKVTEYESVLKLAESEVKVQQATFNESAKQSLDIVTFDAPYAGYVIVSGTTTTSNGYMQVTNSFFGYPFNNYYYQFGNQNNTIMAPILPGTVTVKFGNTNSGSVGATATLTVTYYY